MLNKYDRNPMWGQNDKMEVCSSLVSRNFGFCESDTGQLVRPAGRWTGLCEVGGWMGMVNLTAGTLEMKMEFGG